MTSENSRRPPSPDWDNVPRRPSVRKGNGPRFSTEDRVWYRKPGESGLRGPYLIASNPRPNFFTLSDEVGNPIEGGAEIYEDYLFDV